MKLSKTLLFVLLAMAITLGGCDYNITSNIIVNETPVSFDAAGTAPSEIVFGGKVVNTKTGEWPNDRLVLLFLKSEEVARSITALGEFTGIVSKGEPTQTPFGVVDGLFLLRAPNIYKLSPELLKQDDIALDFHRAYFPNQNNDMNVVSMYTWFDQVEEGNSYKLYIPSKNITYTIVALNGHINDLPPDLLINGATELLESGKIVVNFPGAEEAFDPEEIRDISVQEVQFSSQMEEKEITRLTIPLNNCGGSVELSQKYSYTQTFIHEYTTETGLTVGAEIPVAAWAKILAEIQTKYGFLNGQVDTRTIEYNMAASPGTNVVYYVTWKELWETGSGNVSVPNESVNIPFRVKTNVVYEVTSEAKSCP